MVKADDPVSLDLSGIVWTNGKLSKTTEDDNLFSPCPYWHDRSLIIEEENATIENSLKQTRTLGMTLQPWRGVWEWTNIWGFHKRKPIIQKHCSCRTIWNVVKHIDRHYEKETMWTVYRTKHGHAGVALWGLQRWLPAGRAQKGLEIRFALCAACVFFFLYATIVQGQWEPTWQRFSRVRLCLANMTKCHPDFSISMLW